MQKNRGFSLSEVLIAFLLIASMTLALLKQEWRISRWVSTLHLDALFKQDTAREQAWAHL